jgi:protein PhnA
MKVEDIIAKRSEGKCELCKADTKLNLYEVEPVDSRYADNCIFICDTCLRQIEKNAELDSAHWKLLSETMWSEVPGIQVISWRMLNRLRHESWAMDNLDMMYLSDENLEWAKQTGDHENDGTVVLHRDCNGHQLFNGDSVVLIKSLDVKGSTITARVGTVVKNIKLVAQDTEQIEGRVDNQMIVILTKYVRKQGAMQD